MNKDELHEFIARTQPNICQAVGYCGGALTYSDEWNGYASADTCHTMSVTKSVVSILVGAALERGLIDSVERRVLDFFPDYRVKRGEKTIYDVTVKHLLTMTAPYKYKSEPWTKVCSSDDWTRAALDLLGGRRGLTGEFRYSTLGIHILSGILAAVTGESTVDFANRVLFEPVGAARHTGYCALTAQEHREFIMSKAPKGNVWFCDPQDTGAAGYGLCLSAADMARIGQLCLDGGSVGGQRVVSPEWISEMTLPRHECGEEFRGMSYGYLWWIIDRGAGSYAAVGNSGNVIYVNPSSRVVVAVTGYFKPTVFDRVDFIVKYLEPLVAGR